jgi:hypothetical protein
MKLRVLSIAELEVADAALWYEERQVGLGSAFLANLEATYRRIEADPYHFSAVEFEPVRESIRRASMPTFPNQVIFELMADEAVVLAVAHNARAPEILADPLPLTSQTICAVTLHIPQRFKCLMMP